MTTSAGRAGGRVVSVDDLRRQLEAAADPTTAEVLARYFQTGPGGYGEGDRFAGIKLSRLREIAQPYARRPFVADAWLPFLLSPVHEERLITLVVMSVRAGRGDDSERAELYRTYLDHTDRVNNWDLVDVSAAPVVGGFLSGRDRSPLYGLAGSSLVWDRRIAMISTHRFLRAGEASDTYALAEILLHDQHDLIRKAVGWSLREAGKRVDAAELRSFLTRHAAVMPRTALRYAIEHFDAAERRHYLDLRSTSNSGRPG